MIMLAQARAKSAPASTALYWQLAPWRVASRPLMFAIFAAKIKMGGVNLNRQGLARQAVALPAQAV
jgi:hypothetical protein